MTQEYLLKKFVVLIDADNASPNIVDGLFREVSKYGLATVKRIYGDWTGTHLRGWKDRLLTYAIQPIQQFSYTTGKNSTDSALIIDAMDLLYSGKFDGFCLVSSDSDFTRLASRLREAGHIVMGFGEKKTPKPFINACDKFVYTEILMGSDSEPETSATGKAKALKEDADLNNLLRSVVDSTLDESGWAYLGLVGQQIAKQSPEFDPRNYGFSKLYDLVKATSLFRIEERQDDKSPAKLIYIQFKLKSK
jgi:uncharacterized LabA/DUF88 family protein